MQRGEHSGDDSDGEGALLMHHDGLVNAPNGYVWRRCGDAAWECDDDGSARFACHLGPAIATPSGLEA